MPFSHHSHSGQFCAHAKDSLADMIEEARRRQMLTFALTEHMPRGNNDLYPEEKDAGIDALQLASQFEAFVREAQQLRLKHETQPDQTKPDTQMQILIGFEAEWIRSDASAQLVHELEAKHQFDYFIGSVHHVRGTPIDFSRELYLEARKACGATETGLFTQYYNDQYDMLQALKPKIVGHFDLIRLLSDDPNLQWTTFEGSNVWSQILRNLAFIAGYGGLLEINTAAWRKGLSEPYPTFEVCKAFLELGGSFVLSDDSHGIAHIATNYEKLLAFLPKVGIVEIAYLCSSQGQVLTRFMSIEELEAAPFWDTLFGK